MMRILAAIALVVFVAPAPARAQPGRATGSGSDLIRQGVQFDLNGQYTEARRLFKQAIDLGATPQAKAPAVRAMAMSYAFESDCAGATPYSQQLYEMHLAARDFFSAGEMANELARVCIEAGAFDAAERWYRTGREAGLKEPNISVARRDLWEFRLEHALARLAIRRGDKAEARKHVDLAKSILDKGTNPDQVVYFPYLTGYVALYGGDYKTAVDELQKANQRDGFILCLMGQAYEKLGNAASAKDVYTRALTVSNGHNPPAAYARPFAKARLAALANTQTTIESSHEARFQLDVHVPDAALAAYLPAGWTPNVSTQGAAKDANLRVVFIDRVTINGPDGKPVGKAGSNRLVYLVAPVKDPSGAAVQLVIGGLTEDPADAPGPFGVYLPAVTHTMQRSTASGTVANNAGPVVDSQDWVFAAASGEHLEMHIMFERGVGNRANPSETKFYSAKNPGFYQISRQEQVLDILRNVTTTPPDRVKTFTFKASGGSYATLFDGTEKVLSWDNILWINRTVLLP